MYLDPITIRGECAISLSGGALNERDGAVRCGQLRTNCHILLVVAKKKKNLPHLDNSCARPDRHAFFPQSATHVGRMPSETLGWLPAHQLYPHHRCATLLHASQSPRRKVNFTAVRNKIGRPTLKQFASPAHIGHHAVAFRSLPHRYLSRMASGAIFKYTKDMQGKASTHQQIFVNNTYFLVIISSFSSSYYRS